MDATHNVGSEAQRLIQFQLQGNAAERYERWVVPFVGGPWVPGLLDLAELRGGERVLDIATGTGVVARLAARRVAPGGTVAGLDLNEGMLEVARRLPLPPGDNRLAPRQCTRPTLSRRGVRRCPLPAGISVFSGSAESAP